MTKSSGNVTAADFYHEMYRRFDSAYASGESVLEVSAGEVHKSLKAANRMSLCCNSLYELQNLGDVTQHVPSNGVGASLKLSYSLPRAKGLVLEKSIYESHQVLSKTNLRTKKFEELSLVHPIFRELKDVARQKKSEKATEKICEIAALTSELMCKLQKIRIDNKKFGTVCGAISSADLLSPESMYALDFVRMIGNTHARKIPDEVLLTPKVFAYASHAFLIFAEEVVSERLIWKGK